MKLYKKIILIFLCTINLTNLFPGLLPDTMVFMGNRAYLRVKDLKVGYPVPVYNPSEHRMDDQKRNIVEIKTHKTKNVIEIKAGDSKITVGENQKIYSKNNQKFIPAKDFSIEDMIYSLDKGHLTVTNVEKINLDEATELYDISLKDGCLFLILSDKKAHIMVQDDTPPASVFTPKLFEDFMSVAVIAFVTPIVTIASFGVILLCLKQPPKKPNQAPDKKDDNGSKQDEKTIDKINSLDSTATCTTKAELYAKIYENYIKNKSKKTF